MKRFLYLLILLSLTFLTACTNAQTPTPLTSTQTPSIPTPSLTPVIITVEVTRLIEVTPTRPPTLTPTSTLTPTLTLNPTQQYERRLETQIAEISTQTAASRPTEIPTLDCYQTAFTQLDINSCANSRRDDLYDKMSELVSTVLEILDDGTFQAYQTEWETLAEQECEYLWGQLITDPTSGDLYYAYGSMAPTLKAECLVTKYEDRIRELQLLLYSYNQ